MSAKSKNLSVGFLFDDTLDSNDGVSQYVKTLGAWLATRGNQVSYLAGQTKLRSWAGGKVYSMSRNQRVIFNGNRVSIPLPANRRHIRQVLNQEQFDVIHVQVPYSPFMAQMVINSADPEVAIVGTFHILPKGKLASIGSRGLKQLYGRSLGKFDEIVSVSPPAAEFARGAFGINSVVLPNVVDVARFAAAKPSGKRNEIPKIVFLGRLVERKGCIQLLEAFKLLAQQTADVELTIAGDGPQRAQLESFVRRNNLDRRVKFLGFINEPDKPKLLAGADIACFPSLSGESFGIVLIEAMAAGAGVVIGGNNPGYASVLGARGEALFDPREPKLLAGLLHKLLIDKQLASSLHEWQQAEVKKYDINVVGQSILKMYQQAIAKRKLNRHN